MRHNILNEAQQFFEQHGFVVSFRPFFAQNGALSVCSQPQISPDGVNFFERSLFFYLDDQQQWVVQVTPHGREHQLTHFSTFFESVQFALTLLQA